MHARTAPCDRAAIERILPDGAVHQGLALDAAALPERLLDDLLAEAPAAPAPLRLVVLDRVTDPQNVGTVLRSAAAFGAAALVMPDRHAPPVTGTLAKAASGMLERVPILRVANLARALETMQTAGIWTIGLDGTAGTTLAEAAPPSRTALVLGAEGSGLRRLTAERCDMLAKLPMAPGVESLNVSAAAAAALYELARI